MKRSPRHAALVRALKRATQILSWAQGTSFFLSNGVALVRLTQGEWKDALLQCRLEPQFGRFAFGIWKEAPDLSDVLPCAETPCEEVEITDYAQMFPDGSAARFIRRASGALLRCDEVYVPLLADYPTVVVWDSPRGTALLAPSAEDPEVLVMGFRELAPDANADLRRVFGPTCREEVGV